MKRIIKDSLIPHVDNGYQPTIVQKGALVGMGLLIFCSFLLANLQALFWLNSDWLVGAILPAVVVELTNEERSRVAARPLARSELLDQAADLKAEDMARGQYFSHDSPTGVTPWFWFKVVGYTYAHAGENLAVYFSDSDEVVQAWMDSPTHRANIVNGTYQEIGIGTARGTYQGHSTVFVVQLFGTRADGLTLEATSIINTEPEIVVELATVADESLSETVVLGVESEVERKLISKEPTAANIDQTEIILDQTDVTTAILKQNAESESDIPVAVEKENVTEVTIEPVFFTSTVSSSSGLKPVLWSSIDTVSKNETSLGAQLATSPNRVLQYLYLIIGLITIFALWYSIILGIKHKKMIEVSYGSGLLLLMVGLFYLHTLVTGGVLIN